MPIYEYECRKCGTFEVTQRITETPLRRCPKCRGKVSRLLSAPSIQFKGSGWYVTDYASKGRGKSDSAESKSSDSPSETKGSSEGKSAPKESPAKESSSKDSKASDKAA
jgi:putative FmdB family regulatory protein